jgi:glycosyltransferase involved in cell wall biosynthesis
VHGRDLISFVVPAYNEERCLPATLRAIHDSARACGMEYEVVVADDASTDATAAIARREGARVVGVSHRQIARTRNSGARAAGGDRLIFVDADTRVNAEVLRETLAAFDAGVVGGGAMPVFEEPIQAWARRTMALTTATMRAFRLAAGCYVFCRRAPFEAVGGFDERHFAGEEIMISWALRRHGRFVILRSHVTTSGRKFEDMTFLEFLPLGLRLMSKGMRGVRRREGNEFWYDGKR